MLGHFLELGWATVADYLRGRTIGFVVGQHGVDDAELSRPWHVLEDAGARCLLIAPVPDEVRTSRRGHGQGHYPVDVRLADAPLVVGGLDALVLPDGEEGSNALRHEPLALELVRSFVASGRPLGAFGHAVGTLMDAGVLVGREVTSHPSLRHELERRGVRWRDRRVVVDDPLITSRDSDDIEAFNVQLLAFLDR